MLREQIITYVVGEIERLGMDSCRMSSIAAALHISKKTLYDYFESKDALLEECIQHWIRERITPLRAEDAIDRSPLESLVMIHRLVLRQVLPSSAVFYHDLQRRKNLLLLVEEAYGVEVRQMLRRHYDAGVGMGYIRAELNVDHSLLFFDQQLRQVYLSFSQGTRDLTESYTFNIFTHLSGICTEKGRELLKEIPSVLLFN